jgi:hypothetical protein
MYRFYLEPELLCLSWFGVGHSKAVLPSNLSGLLIGEVVQRGQTKAVLAGRADGVLIDTECRGLEVLFLSTTAHIHKQLFPLI